MDKILFLLSMYEGLEQKSAVMSSAFDKVQNPIYVTFR